MHSRARPCAGSGAGTGTGSSPGVGVGVGAGTTASAYVRVAPCCGRRFTTRAAVGSTLQHGHRALSCSTGSSRPVARWAPRLELPRAYARLAAHPAPPAPQAEDAALACTLYHKLPHTPNKSKPQLTFPRARRPAQRAAAARPARRLRLPRARARRLAQGPAATLLDKLESNRIWLDACAARATQII